jgi:uncharacterized protein DUF3352
MGGATPMKKTGLILAILLVLAVAGGAVWYFLLRPVPVYHAEEILPSTTIALLQIPNVDLARQRWDQTPIGRILQEPEVRAFWEQPSRSLREKLVAIRGGGEANATVDSLKKIFAHFHGEAFIGVLGYDLSPHFSPHIVAGFDAGKNRKEAQQSIEEMAAEFRTRYPKGVREEKKHLGIAYETWSPEKSLVICYAQLGNLFIFSTDELSLQTCIELAKKDRDNPLKNDEVFKQSVAQIDPQRDLFAYLNPGQALGKFAPLLATIPQAGSGLKDMAAMKAAVLSSRFEPTGTIDQAFVLMPEAGRPVSFQIVTPWERKSLPLVSSRSVFYGVTCFDFGRYWDSLLASASEAPGLPTGKAFQEFTQMLESQNIKIHPDLLDKLGREFAVQLQWSDQEQLPQFFLMAETSDGPGLVATLDRFLTLMSVAAPVPKPAIGAPTGPNTLDVEGKIIHWITLDAQKGIGIYYVHLDPFIVFGFSGGSMTAYVNAFAKKQFQGFDTNPVFQSASAKMPKSVNTFVFMDNKPLFTRLYNLVAPLAMLGASFLPDQKAVDFSKLPKTQTISAHLSPSFSYQYLDAQGFHRYSNGPIPPEAPFLIAGIGAGLAVPAYVEAQKQAAAQAAPAPRPPGVATPGTAPTTNAPPTNSVPPPTAPIPTTNAPPPAATSTNSAPASAPTTP